MIWHAIRVHGGKEIEVRDEIRTLGLPKLPLRLVTGQRLSSRSVPLISRYLFLGFVSEPEWHQIMRIPFVYGPVSMKVGAPPYVVPADEIYALDGVSRMLNHEYRLSFMGSHRPTRRRRPRKSRRSFPDTLQARLDAMPIAVTKAAEEIDRTAA